MPLATSLGPAKVAFYAAVATVIPVLLVVYVVAVNELIAKTVGPSLRQSFAAYIRQGRKPLSGDPGRVEIVVSFLRVFVNRSYWRTNLYMDALAFLFAAAVALPALGEYESLHTLMSGVESATTRALALLGAIFALLLVIAPVTYTTLKALIGAAVAVGLSTEDDSQSSSRQ